MSTIRKNIRRTKGNNDQFNSLMLHYEEIKIILKDIYKLEENNVILGKGLLMIKNMLKIIIGEKIGEKI